MTCRYLTFEDRKSIEALYAANTSLVEIASKLGVHLATIYREMTRGSTGELDNNGRSGYSIERRAYYLCRHSDKGQIPQTPRGARRNRRADRNTVYYYLCRGNRRAAYSSRNHRSP